MEEVLEERRRLVDEVLELMEAGEEMEARPDAGHVKAIVSQKVLLSHDALDGVTVHKLYREARKSPLFRKYAKDEDYEGLVEEECAKGEKCVLTQKPIVDPVAAPCGHVFDREGVAFYFKGAKGAAQRCPYVGCTGSWKNFLM